MNILLLLLLLSNGLASRAQSVTVPAGALYEVRLRQSLSTETTKPGTPIEADVIAPVLIDGTTLVPRRASITGRVVASEAIGKGLRRQRARITLEFDTLQLPDGSTRPIKTRIRAVDNGRETVDDQGRIIGIRPRGPMGHRVAGITRNIFIWDPILQGVLAVSTLAVLRFPAPEINLPAGAELWMELTQPLVFDQVWPRTLPRVAESRNDRMELQSIIRGLSVRTTKVDPPRPADVVNVLLLGSPDAARRAFENAGWVKADRLTKGTGWMTFRSVAEAKPYPTAPMGAMLLDERPPLLEYSKALNSASKRHHTRVFSDGRQWKGMDILPASGTQDVAITFAFSKGKLIHAIDRNIDNERAKMVNDLIHTGCVDAAELVDRPWLPHGLKNSTGEQLSTDGAIAVLELNACREAEVVSQAPPPAKPLTAGRTLHLTTREFFLTLGQDFTVNNPIVQIGEGFKFLWRRMSGREAELRVQPGRSTDIERTTPHE